MVGGPEDEIVQIVCEVDYIGAYYSTCETVSNGIEDIGADLRPNGRALSQRVRSLQEIRR